MPLLYPSDAEKLNKLRHNRPALLLIALGALILLTIAGLFTVPAAAAFGAFTTLIVGIAAQQSLGNIFAGVLIAVTHPFKVGNRITGKVGNDDIDGEVKAIGIVFTQVAAENGGVAFLPNGLILGTSLTVRPS